MIDNPFSLKLVYYFIVGILLISILGCSTKTEKSTLFQLLASEKTGIHFENTITTNDTINLMTYEYLYNGGGVGIGHFNNDSLPDIFFTGNQVKSEIYLNEGNFKFKDITNTSGIDTSGKWCNGISIVDINSDGLDDIYISVGGMGNKSVFPNLLYINQGNGTFREEASVYGLADIGESVQSVFFDYDLDGDLDMYLLTGGGFEVSAINARPILTNGSGRNTDRLYRNDTNEETGQPFYTNVSYAAGITIEGFGLGVSVFDINNDSYPDVYVSNDYLSRDFIYENNQDGTFTEKSKEYFGHLSHFSMGNDVADIDNDGLVDIVTMDMLPEDHKRRQLMSGAGSNDFFQMALGFGYGHQHMRNMLHKNNGTDRFSEIGQLSGIDRTDWSWAPLLADFDNDGFNDLFVTNGYGKDITDLDFVKFRENSSSAFTNFEELRKSVVDCLQYRPAISIENYMFKNNGDLTFTKKTEDWGFDVESISNGAAYSDLDLDGDLDLVVNNINKPAFIYKNNLNESKPEGANYLKLNLVGSKNNKKGFGASVDVYTNKRKQTKFNQPVRGFESTVDCTIHFGFGDVDIADSIVVTWPDTKKSTLQNVKTNRTVSIDYATANLFKKAESEKTKFFTKDTTLTFTHYDSYFNDYAVQPLLTHGFSNQGPGMAVGDLNSDGLQDVFIGGSYGFKSTIIIQKNNGSFKTYELEDSEIYEDLGALFFDANGDGQQDMYVVSGGSERYKEHKGYQDRLYINNKGKLNPVELPAMNTSTSTVVGGDFDRDGDIDLFVGGRFVPGSFPEVPRSYLLENKEGTFVDVTKTVCPKLQNIGMVTSAVFTDYDNDGFLDLMVVGEFMPISVFKGNGETLVYNESLSGLQDTSGIWNSIIAEDFDNDGDMDYVLGNLGINSNLKASKSKPINLHYADFDDNGSLDPIFSTYEEGDYYPIASLDELTKQLPIVKKKILYYNTYAKSTTSDILNLFEGVTYVTLDAEMVKSSFLENLGNGDFKISALTTEAQIAPVNGVVSEDLNGDGLLDLVLVGNSYNTEVVYGRYDASIGTVLINKGDNDFEAMAPTDSGFSIIGDAKSLVRLDTKLGESKILVSKNNDSLDAFTLNGPVLKMIPSKNGEAYALIQFRNSSKRKVEFTLGGGYLSQTSKSIRVTSQMESITFYDPKGKITRTINLMNKA